MSIITKIRLIAWYLKAAMRLGRHAGEALPIMRSCAVETKCLVAAYNTQLAIGLLRLSFGKDAKRAEHRMSRLALPRYSWRMEALATLSFLRLDIPLVHFSASIERFYKLLVRYDKSDEAKRANYIALATKALLIQVDASTPRAQLPLSTLYQPIRMRTWQPLILQVFMEGVQEARSSIGEEAGTCISAILTHLGKLSRLMLVNRV